jgi:hypothetical protein
VSGYSPIPATRYAARTGRLDPADATAAGAVAMMNAAPQDGHAHSGHCSPGASGHSPATS